MAEYTLIPWCHHTYNPWIGCFKISPGCENCYAAVDHPARIARAQGRELWGKDADRQIKAESGWREPLRWDRAAAKAEERRRVFCASQADVFEDRPDLTEPLARLWRTILYSTHLDWLLLTKRPQSVLKRLQDVWAWQKERALRDDCLSGWIDGSRPPENVWLGVTAENQEYADRRIPILLGIPAAVRFVSAEPLLGPIDFRRGVYDMGGIGPRGTTLDGIDWIIAGGESGPNARPFDLAWARSIRDQCRAAGVAFFMKQFGARPYDSFYRSGVADQAIHPKHKAGADPAEWPADLRVREFPGP